MSLDILNHLSAIDRLAALEALDKKRREESYIKFWQPQEQQLPHFKEFTSDTKIFGILGGNRSGKTEEGAFIALAWALGKDYFRGESTEGLVKDLPIPAPPNTIWLVGLDFAVLRDVIWREKIIQGRGHAPLLPKDPQAVEKINSGDFQIFFKNGSVITGKSADSGREKFQGASVDLVWIDEECEEDVYDECYQRTVDCGGKILLTLTPLVDIASGIRAPWVFDLYEDMKKGRPDVKFVKLSVLDNPYVPKEEKVKLIEKWSGHHEERARLYGDFIQRSGLVYNLWKGKLKPEGHLVQPFKIPREWRRFVSIDPAATGTTAAIWAAVDERNDIYLYREYYKSNLIVSEHAKNILVRNAGDPIDVWYLDPKWGSQRNNETHKTGAQLYRDSNIPVRLPDVGEDYGLQESREYIAATLNPAARHPKVYVFSDLVNFQHEITHYVWDYYGRGELKGLSKEKPLKRNDHLLNAFQYLCSQRPRGKRGAALTSNESRSEFVRLNSYS